MRGCAAALDRHTARSGVRTFQSTQDRLKSKAVLPGQMSALLAQCPCIGQLLLKQSGWTSKRSELLLTVDARLQQQNRLMRRHTVMSRALTRYPASAGQLVVVPSYFDFVRVRNFLAQEDVEFASLHEYASVSELARGRSLFADGRFAHLCQLSAGLSVHATYIPAAHAFVVPDNSEL